MPFSLFFDVFRGFICEIFLLHFQTKLLSFNIATIYNLTTTVDEVSCFSVTLTGGGEKRLQLRLRTRTPKVNSIKSIEIAAQELEYQQWKSAKFSETMRLAFERRPKVFQTFEIYGSNMSLSLCIEKIQHLYVQC